MVRCGCGSAGPSGGGRAAAGNVARGARSHSGSHRQLARGARGQDGGCAVTREGLTDAMPLVIVSRSRVWSRGANRALLLDEADVGRLMTSSSPVGCTIVGRLADFWHSAPLLLLGAVGRRHEPALLARRAACAAPCSQAPLWRSGPRRCRWTRCAARTRSLRCPRTPASRPQPPWHREACRTARAGDAAEGWCVRCITRGTGFDVRRALRRSLTRRAVAQLVACVVATLLLPLLQLALSRRAERRRDTPAARAAAPRAPLPPWKGLPRYVTVLPRLRPEPEPGCQGWRVGGGHAPSSEDEADLDAGPSPPLKTDDCYLPLDREPGLRGAAREPQPAPQRPRRNAAGWGPRRLMGASDAARARRHLHLQRHARGRGPARAALVVGAQKRRCVAAGGTRRDSSSGLVSHAAPPHARRAAAPQRRRCCAPRCAARCGRRTRVRR